MYRSLMLIAAASIAASAFVPACFAQGTRDTVTPPVSLHPPVNLDADTLRARLAPGYVGLKPQSSTSSGGLGLPELVEDCGLRPT